VTPAAAEPASPESLEGVACAHCGRSDTALQRDPDGGALVCLAGRGCGRGLSLREALGHDRRPRCASPSCPREPLPQGRCAVCLAAAHATRLLALRGRDG